MKTVKKSRICDLNECLTCRICRGYFVDATTIVECLHTFCRSCIVKYLESNKYCPVCEVQVHKTKPLLSIKADQTIQDLVYKLVPRLFQNEMQRRREFYEKNPDSKPTASEQWIESHYQYLLTPEEIISVTLNYFGNRSSPRYLRCPAAVSVAHLHKLIRAKYDLTDNHRIEVLYNQDLLHSRLTLIDVAYIYGWKKTRSLDLVYRIYECTSKPKADDCTKETQETVQTNNNTWREVQLRISENGEMCITGIQEQPAVDVDEKSNLTPTTKENAETSAAIKVVEEKKEVVEVAVTESSEIDAVIVSSSATVDVSKTVAPTTTTTAAVSSVNSLQLLESVAPSSLSMEKLPVLQNVAPTTTVYSTINNTKCSTKTEETKTTTNLEKAAPAAKVEKQEPPPAAANTQQQGKKRKCESSEPEPKPKQIILNHSLGLLNLSNNHPLKKHSLTRETNESAVANNNNNSSKVAASPAQKPQIPARPIPTSTFAPLLNVPRPKMVEQKSVATTITPATSAAASKPPPKPKTAAPLGYKTLRDPPKSWNSQISKANVNKTSVSELKSVRPAKFFKIRNNMPRYLGNPASGVKPMYQVHVSPEKEKNNAENVQKREEKTEIRKHSIVKIDPKTLKPISERAPDHTNLSRTPHNHNPMPEPMKSIAGEVPKSVPDLKINTSSVSIFSPLKNHSSPKSDRKSPKSPNNKPKAATKPNLSFTPPNPFVPNLASPTVSPGQFLFPGGTPPGFPPYDHRVMAAAAAYRQLWYGQSGFGATNPTLAGLGLSLDQRKPVHEQKTISQPSVTTGIQKSSPARSSLSLKKPVSEKSLENTVEKLVQSRTKENEGRSREGAAKTDKKAPDVSATGAKSCA